MTQAEFESVTRVSKSCCVGFVSWLHVDVFVIVASLKPHLRRLLFVASYTVRLIFTIFIFESISKELYFLRTKRYFNCICIIFVSLQNARVKAYTCVLYTIVTVNSCTQAPYRTIDPRPLFKSLLSFAFLKLRALSLRWCYNLVSKSSYNALTYRSAVALAQKNTDNISTFIRYVRLFPWFIRTRLFTRNKQIKFDVLCSRNCVWIRFCCCDCCKRKKIATVSRFYPDKSGQINCYQFC